MARIVSSQFYFPVVNAMQGQWVSHNCRDGAVICTLAYFVPCDLYSLAFLLDAQIKMLVIEYCPDATMSKARLAKLVFRKHTSRNLELKCFENRLVIKVA